MDNNSFFSIDKLIEFGLGLSIAQQMITIMNQSMQSMYVPGSYMSLPVNPEAIYVGLNKIPTGPLSASQFNTLVKEGKVNKDTLAWIPGLALWKPVKEIPELLKIIALSPPPLP